MIYSTQDGQTGYIPSNLLLFAPLDIP